MYHKWHRAPSLEPKPCGHENLTFQSCSHADNTSYRGYTPAQLLTAAGKDRNTGTIEPASTFPAPLVLPGDDLAQAPMDAPQSYRSWLREKDRNEVGPKRRVIYVAAPPRPDEDIDHVRAWKEPRFRAWKPQARMERRAPRDGFVSRPETKDVIEYLAAFYHGMPVKQLPIELRYSNWDNDGTKSSKPERIPPLVALRTSSEMVGISTRACPDDIFHVQFSLDDLLDVAISVLPDDAYALLMLVEHDLFEDEDDDFCCGRAYGGSRVAIVSSARYNPMLDIAQDVERVHAWPASQCRSYVEECCKEHAQPAKKARVHSTPSTKTKATPAPLQSTESESSPMQNAIDASLTVSLDHMLDPGYLQSLWLSRLTRAASHELGHCFGIAHCVYYACIMQGTASMSEDVRQPPYLCPVDLAKLQRALNLTEDGIVQRDKALLEYCSKSGKAFAAFEGWIGGRLSEGSE